MRFPRPRVLLRHSSIPSLPNSLLLYDHRISINIASLLYVLSFRVRVYLGRTCWNVSVSSGYGRFESQLTFLAPQFIDKVCKTIIRSGWGHCFQSVPMPKEEARHFFGRTRYVILLLSLLSLTFAFGNSLVFTFTVICMDDVLPANSTGMSGLSRLGGGCFQTTGYSLPAR